MFCEQYDSFVRALERRRFLVHAARDAAEAKAIALSLIGGGSVGFGGSMTVADMGLYEALAEAGNDVFWHWRAVSPAERPAVLAAAAQAVWYVSSVNAVTGDGRLVNIDGTGNRVAGMFAGPKKSILFIGKNKYVQGGLDEALARIKREACPANAKRLGLNTPCAVTGACADCASPARMCNVTTVLERTPGLMEELHIVLIDEAMGY